MTPKQFEAARKKMGVDNETFITLLGVSRSPYKYWKSGVRTIPEYIEKHVKVLLWVHKNCPENPFVTQK